MTKTVEFNLILEEHRYKEIVASSKENYRDVNQEINFLIEQTMRLKRLLEDNDIDLIKAFKKLFDIEESRIRLDS